MMLWNSHKENISWSLFLPLTVLTPKQVSSALSTIPFYGMYSQESASMTATHDDEGQWGPSAQYPTQAGNTTVVWGD